MDINDNDVYKQNEQPPKGRHRRYAYFRDDHIMFLVTHDAETVSDDLLREFKTRVNNVLGEANELAPDVLPQKFSFPAPGITEEEGKNLLVELLNPTSVNEEEAKRWAEAKKRAEVKRQAELERLKKFLKDKEKEGKQLHTLQNRLLNYGVPPDQPTPFNSAFSLLACKLNNVPDKADKPLSLLNDILNLRSAFREKPEVEISSSAADSAPQVEKMNVVDVSPNWTMSATPNGSGTGGPGGLPRPFMGTDEDVQANAQYKFDITDKLANLYGQGSTGAKGENVDVAILDTAPCLHDLVLAQKEWPKNDLIQGLLGPNGKLSVYPATYEELQRMDNASLNWHDYEMSNHGLFAAGIVHSIVPEARIHLIEVLNQWGVGDLVSLAAGLAKASKKIYQRRSGRHLVVNCSWMLDLPLVGEHCSEIDETDPDYEFVQAILHFVLAEREQASAIWAICNSISLAGGQVIAAAGNDWNKERKDKKEKSEAGISGQTQGPRTDAPEARYPAGFVSVIGVGALPKESKIDATKHKASNYSNLGDKPEMIAIMTLGGEEGETNGKNNGVLGLYLGEKYPVEDDSPPKPENHRRKFKMERRHDKDEKNSWAWWSGTSFATPIVTGTIASLLSVSPKPGNNTPNKVKELVQVLYANSIIQNNGTEAEEDVMEVKQGPIPPGP